VDYLRKIIIGIGHLIHLKCGFEALVFMMFLKIEAYEKQRIFTYIVPNECPQMLSHISSNDLYVTEKNVGDGNSSVRCMNSIIPAGISPEILECGLY